jgi:hypothetical protein
MEFWSKGLGKKTIALTLTKGEPRKSEGTLCLRGNMEEPVSWEYVMKLSEDDIIDFFGLLKEPAVADYLYESPRRWQLYRDILLGGVKLGVLALASSVRRIFGREHEEEDVVIVVPPPVERKPKRKRAVRRRLGAKTTAAPAPQSAPESNEPAEILSAKRA